MNRLGKEQMKVCQCWHTRQEHRPTLCMGHGRPDDIIGYVTRADKKLRRFSYGHPDWACNCKKFVERKF